MKKEKYGFLRETTKDVIKVDMVTLFLLINKSNIYN